MLQKELSWWQKTTVYQIYPRSFRDTTGNGIGDLQGIIEKLDYLENLGVETIWFSPFFKSPQKDHGYDISGFRKIDPVYGSMHDFDNLVELMHKRKMKIVLDLVLNHTSDQHPWFIESASSRDNPKRDWYIWADGQKPKGKKPPNNWKAIPGGPAWKYDEKTDQWYYFHFLPFQPDLNYRNPEVKEEMFNTMRFWLDKGVDGFRLDILHSIYEDESLQDDEFSWHLLPSDKRVASLFRKHKYDLNLTETIEFALELRHIISEYQPERFLVGEVFGDIEELRKYYGPHNNGLNMCFLFEFMNSKPTPKTYKKVISRIEKSLPYPYTPTFVYGNHDRIRYISRINNDPKKAKLLATMQLTLRGVPFIYYGEEIGMRNVKFDLKSSEDPIGRKYSKFPLGSISKLFNISVTRDGCRTPMQWNSELNAGFSSNKRVEPWLSIPETYIKINVERENRNPSSLLNCYKRLLKVRRSNTVLSEGLFEFLKRDFDKYCLSYRRYTNVDEIYIYLNFSKNELLLNCPVEKPNLLFSTLSNRVALDIEAYNGNIKITPFEGIILK
jgi:oligo-1,6-glucosidase/alpha-glucosidase